MSVLNPYLNFRGDARDAMEFYHSVFGGELTVSTFEELGATWAEDADRALVMHSQLETPAGFTLMACDVPSHMDHAQGVNTFSVSLSGPADDETELRDYWQGLGDGAAIDQDLATAPWGATFGMLTDRFGIHWLVNISAREA